jgi:hypothetical protein
LYIVSAFKGQQGYKKEASQLINAKSPDVTPKNGSVVTSDNSIPDSEGKSNSFDENSSKKADDGLRSALKKLDKEYWDEVKAKADEKVAKATAKAEAKSTECEQTKPRDAGAGMRHTNGRYKGLETKLK